MKNSIKSIAVLFLAVVLVFSAAELRAAELEDNFDEELVLAEASWPGIEGKNAVVKLILENIGYNIDDRLLEVPVIQRSLAQGDVDIWLGSWFPSQKAAIEEISDDVDLVRTHLNEAIYITAVPEYVYEAGITSHEDLAEHAEKFDYTIYAGPIGEGAEEVLAHAVEEDIYGLGDWNLVTGNWPSTIATAESHMENEEWVVFPGWEPHWMNVVLDIRYLEDPEGIWGDAESWVQTLVRHDLQEDYPNLYTFFENFKITSDIQNEWIYGLDREEMPADEMAEEWVKDNIRIVDQWLFDVKASNGESARQVLRDELGI